MLCDMNVEKMKVLLFELNYEKITNFSTIFNFFEMHLYKAELIKLQIHSSGLPWMQTEYPAEGALQLFVQGGNEIMVTETENQFTKNMMNIEMWKCPFNCYTC